jgi:hypothetical protein
MKNKTNRNTLNKSVWHLMMLMVLFLMGSNSFAQVAKTKKPTNTTSKRVVTKADQNVQQVLTNSNAPFDPVAEAKRLSGDKPLQPQGYTATKVSVSETAAPELKAAFAKEHGADFYYTYLDANGKTVSPQQYEEAVRVETEKQSKNNSNTNPKQ